MNCLLDTNALLWSLGSEDQLTKKARQTMIEASNSIYVSVVSLWEIAIKQSIGKLELTHTLDNIIQEINRQRFILLPISLDTIRIVRDLPYHHRDPFDRIIIAQALANGLSIITSDIKFDEYKVRVHW